MGFQTIDPVKVTVTNKSIGVDNTAIVPSKRSVP